MWAAGAGYLLPLKAVGGAALRQPMETIFLLPFAVAFTGLSAGAFVAMIVFLLLLVEGLVWAWRKGFLTWK